MTRTRNRHSGPAMTWLARVTVLALGAATLTVPLAVMTGAEAARIQPRTTVPTTTLAVIKTIRVGSNPSGVAVNDQDDTVYVTNFSSDNVSVINGRTGERTDDTITVGSGPEAVAVNQEDDTVYVTNYFASPGTVSVINGRTRAVATINVGNNPGSVAINQTDDTVYVGNIQSRNVSVINGRTGLLTADTITLGVPREPLGIAVNQRDDTLYVTTFAGNEVWVTNGRSPTVVSSIGVGANPAGVAMDQDDDTVYVANYLANPGTVSVINGRTGQRTDDTITVGTRPFAVAIDQANDTVYVTNNNSNNVSVINGRNTDDSKTIGVGSSPYLIAVDSAGTNAGLVYVTNRNLAANTVSVIGRVTPSLGALYGEAGNRLTISVDAPQVAYAVDDSTIASVSFDDTPSTGLTAESGDDWKVTVPAGSGTVNVKVTFRGGLIASAGTFTYGAAPNPTPTPSPPAPAIVPASQVLSGQVGVCPSARRRRSL